MAALELNIQHKIAGFKINASFTASKDITGIFGPSGAGKSSLFKAIAGTLQPQNGEILLNNKPLFSSKRKINLPLHKRNVGMVFQDFKLFPHLSVRGNLLFSKTSKTNPLFERVVKMLKIGHLLNRKPEYLSGGEKQRVSIGRAILSKPDILLFDEPFSALDTKIKHEIIKFIKQIPSQFDIPVLIISHELSDLLQLSSELVLIKNGKVLNAGDIFDLLNHRPSIKLLSHSGLKNILELKVGRIDREKELVCLSPLAGGGKIKVVSDIQCEVYPGMNVTMFLAPEDVAISLHPLNNVSIQNQLKGKVEKIFYINGKMICMVHAGIKIMAEVARTSVETLGLKPGKEVWCLFKSVAPKII